MTSNEIRQRFLDFFANRGHKILPSASLVPENDPSVLFNTAGMQPLVPYLMGQKHPLGTRLASCQKCVRTGDIDEVGDNRHLTFFEMLGNWSLGDYFKEESIEWSYKFLTDKNEGLGLDPNRMYVTVFEGDENAPRDNEAVEIWKKYMPENRIYFLPAKNNWWSAGSTGPCGPDTEIFYDVNDEPLGDMTHDQFVQADDEGRVVEIWNNVFMEYERKIKTDKLFEYENLTKQGLEIPSDFYFLVNLPNKNIDTGMGLERITMVKQNVKTVFETDLFSSVINAFMSSPDVKIKDEKSFRIIADHLRASFFLIADGVKPGNTGQGYVLRRLIRRIVRYMDQVLSLNESTITSLGPRVIDPYIDSGFYPEMLINSGNIANIIKEEETKFRKTLQEGLKQLKNIAYVYENGKESPKVKRTRLSGLEAFNLFQTYGFPIELTLEICKEWGIEVDLDDFNQRFKEHQKLSQTASAGMFKGGLANHNKKTIQLHTAHHLLLAALQQVLGKGVKQRGSNITEERLRIDFIFDRKMTDEEKKQVEDIINEKISQGLNVVRREMPLVEAEKLGAEMEFGAKYPEMVSVYMIEDKDGNHFSKEFCGGPHVENIGTLGTFKIQKEEAVSAGVRRIKAVLA